MAEATSKLLCSRCHQLVYSLVLFLYHMCFILPITCQVRVRISTLTSNSTMPFNTTLVSPGGVFEVGFTSGSVSPNVSSLVYTLAIWYAQTGGEKVVWVADRAMLLSSSNPSLSLSAIGDLQVHDNSGVSPKLVWTSNTAHLKATNATILDTGNLVLFDSTSHIVWQSFDTPTDTLLPTQVFDANSSKTIAAWRTPSDWSPGAYSVKWDSYFLTAYWQVPYPWHTSISDYWQAEGQFSHVALTPDGDFQGRTATGSVVSIGTAALVGVHGRLVRLTLDSDGNLRMYSLSVGISTWKVEWKAVNDDCRVSGYCGPYAICNNGECSCPTGFRLIAAQEPRLGCERIEPAAYCNTSKPADGFVPVLYVDWAFNDLTKLVNVNLSSCMQKCLESCECQAVIAHIPDSATGIISECWHKKDALLDGKPVSVRQSYLRVAGSSVNLPSPAPSPALSMPSIPRGPRDGNALLKIVASTLGAVILMLVLLACILASLSLTPRIQKLRINQLEETFVAAKGAMVRFSYPEILLMTSNFETKIGEGGYGTVFKGQIGTAATVAVKRLNKELSNHVEKEFLNEVDSIGLIHHVHLVSLLGYCAESNHRLLVYEYIPRGSLDRTLFQTKDSKLVLEWRPRFAIAIQTARGLAYLHDDCKQRIIHCDVKPENILLEDNLCAKVADFGLSRIMNREQTRTMTLNIRGTCGYLAPEWTSDGRVSITNKVDVFSFGMVLLELISGCRNLVAPDVYFPTWAFRKMEAGTWMEAVDPALTGIVDVDEVRRALMVAFWCINDKPHVRPTMSKVVQMLQGHVGIEVPVPRPDYFDNVEFESSVGSHSASTQSRHGIESAEPINSRFTPPTS